MMPEKYKWTQEDSNGFVTTEHGADVIQDENEKRLILQDLGKALLHAGFNNNSYPQDMQSTPYVRGATSDADYTITLGGEANVVKIRFSENKTIFLRFSGSVPQWSIDGANWLPLGPLSLGDLSDVQISNPQNGDYLRYDATSGKWKNFTA